MDSLSEKMDVILEKIAEYAKPSLTGEMSYLTQSADGKMLSVVDVSVADGKHYADIDLAVRIDGDYIIIEHDMNDKPLVDALVQAGIPRNQIVLAYTGEQTPGAAAA